MKSEAEILKVKEQAESWILQTPGVTGVDVGPAHLKDVPSGDQPDELAIRIYVNNRSTLAPRLADLNQIEGIPVVIIERRFDLH